MRSISGVGSHDNKAFGTKDYCMFGVRHGQCINALYNNERGFGQCEDPQPADPVPSCEYCSQRSEQTSTFIR